MKTVKKKVKTAADIKAEAQLKANKKAVNDHKREQDRVDKIVSTVDADYQEFCKKHKLIGIMFADCKKGNITLALRSKGLKRYEEAGLIEVNS